MRWPCESSFASWLFQKTVATRDNSRKLLSKSAQVTKSVLVALEEVEKAIMGTFAKKSSLATPSVAVNDKTEKKQKSIEGIYFS